MSTVLKSIGQGALYLAASFGAICVSAQQSAERHLEPFPASISPVASTSAILGVSRAGNRIVAVGDHGVILLSDDGVTFRQAKQVPVSSGLTSVSFVDERNGWAAGHWGVVLHTADGGDTWTLQRVDTSVDRPIFSIHFWNTNDGVAVGLWSLILRTKDAGKTWVPIKPVSPPELQKTEINLFSIFGTAPNDLFVAGERGYVLRSFDGGETWNYANVGVKASLWAGAQNHLGDIFVGGLRGAFLHSTDKGRTWQSIDLKTKSSITDIKASGENVAAFGLDGLTAFSKDGGVTFTTVIRANKRAITSALPHGSGYLVFSDKGVVGVLGLGD
jgi:photosystem II stability/assembly factor-like uncharacterized protein